MTEIKQKLLDIKNLSVSFGDVKVVDHVSLSISHGETLALVGSSGSGKTLTALSVMRLLPHDAVIHQNGHIFLEGVDLLAQSELNMRKVRGAQIGMIFQEASTAFSPVMTVGEQIESSIKKHLPLSAKERLERILSLLDKVGIKDPKRTAKSYPHMLSGGMRQRAMIAMALAPEPGLLIADEPTTALDVTLQAQILDLLSDIQQRQKLGLLFITHDLAIAKKIANNVAIISEGKVLECETATHFFSHPDHTYSQALFNALPSWEKRSDKPSKADKQLSPLFSVEDMKVYFTIQKSLFKQRRKTLKAVDGVSFSIEKGQTYALVGESGSGKTTIAKGVLNLERLTAGKLSFAGEIRKNIQMIFQDPATSMNPRMRVGQILSEGAKAQRVFKSREAYEEKIDELLKYVGLDESCKQRYPHEFSGGQRQRICIARALVMQSELLICDEPTSALDVVTQMEILDLLKSLQEKLGLSYLLITHNMSVVAYLAHQVGVMHEGKIVEQGGVEQVLFDPQHAYTKALLAAVPEL